MAFLTAVLPVASTYAAMSQTDLDEFANIGVYFYERGGSARNFCNISGGDCYITGDTRDEKLWSGLRHSGFTPEQTAAIMGNIYHEGGSPVRQEQSYIDARKAGCKTREDEDYDIYKDETDGQHHGNCMQRYQSAYSPGEGVAGIGLGFIQWTSHSRRMGYLQLVESMGLIKYFEGDAYLTYGQMSDAELKNSIPEEDYWALWCAALQYIYKELMEGRWASDFAAKSSSGDVGAMAGYVAKSYEVCSKCGEGESSYNARVEDAKKIYERYEAGEFDAIENGTATPAQQKTDSETKTDDVDGEKKDEGGSNQSGAASIQRSDSCSIPYNVIDGEDALKIAQQFIVDTNAMYGKNYILPEGPVEVKYTLFQTPNDDSDVTAIGRQDFISRGIIEEGDSTACCWGGCNCGQCTALSGWFTATMTGYLYNGGHGGRVVAKLKEKNPDIEILSEPEPFSVFSEGSGSSSGHTGIVVGDYGDGTYLTIENNISTNKLRIMRRTKAGFEAKNAVFARMIDKIKIKHIGEQ